MRSTLVYASKTENLNSFLQSFFRASIDGPPLMCLCICVRYESTFQFLWSWRHCYCYIYVNLFTSNEVYDLFIIFVCVCFFLFIYDCYRWIWNSINANNATITVIQSASICPIERKRVKKCWCDHFGITKVSDFFFHFKYSDWYPISTSNNTLDSCFFSTLPSVTEWVRMWIY